MRMNVEAEIRELKRRVGELEGSHGFLSGQVREVHRALLGFQERTQEEFEEVRGEVGKLKTDLSQFRTEMERFERRTEQQLDALPRALAEIVRAEFDRRDKEAGR